MITPILRFILAATRSPRQFVVERVRRFYYQWAGERARRARQARRVAAQLLAEFHRLGFSRRSPGAGGRRRKVKFQRVRFEQPLLLTNDELWAPIDLKRLPTGVRTNDLRDEDAVRSIEDRLGVSVRVDYLANGKFCFVLRLAGTTFPEVLPITAVKLPAEAPPLAFPLGLNGQGEQCWGDLARMPHLLVVGPTSKGKSTLIHTIITTWISRNRAADIELWLADHKGGVELNRYRDLMGKGREQGIVRRFSSQPEETVNLLQLAMKELERRLEVMRRVDASDIDDYAKMTGQHLRRIAIVIDEIFFLMLNKNKVDAEPGTGKGMTVAQWAEHLFAKIASAGRAPGIHLVIATQRTGKDVLTPLITSNFETRVVFGVSDMYQSIYLLGNASAVQMPRGRIILREVGGADMEIQTPLIKPDQIRLLISRIARYGPDGGLDSRGAATMFARDARLLLTVAVEACESRFAIRELADHPRIKGAVHRGRIEEIAQRLERDQLLIAARSNRPRRVAPLVAANLNIIDSIYGVDAAMDAPKNAMDAPMDADILHERVHNNTAAPEQRMNAENNASIASNSASCDQENQPDIAPDPDIPDVFRRFLDQQNPENPS